MLGRPLPSLPGAQRITADELGTQVLGLDDGVDDELGRKMEDVDVRSRAITRKLRDVEELPSNPQPLLPELLRTEEQEAG